MKKNLNNSCGFRHLQCFPNLALPWQYRLLLLMPADLRHQEKSKGMLFLVVKNIVTLCLYLRKTKGSEGKKRWFSLPHCLPHYCSCFRFSWIAVLNAFLVIIFSFHTSNAVRRKEFNLCYLQNATVLGIRVSGPPSDTQIRRC